MAKLFIPVGIPGCGKSTFYKVLENPYLKRVSSDDIREALGDINDQSRNDEVFARYHVDIERHLLMDYDVYADATNLRAFARANLIEIAERAEAEIHVLLFTNVRQAVTRNQARLARVVPPEAMERMIAQYEVALRDVHVEPHDSITRISGT